jgi:hypothetical protein
MAGVPKTFKTYYYQLSNCQGRRRISHRRIGRAKVYEPYINANIAEADSRPGSFLPIPWLLTFAYVNIYHPSPTSKIFQLEDKNLTNAWLNHFSYFDLSSTARRLAKT